MSEPSSIRKSTGVRSLRVSTILLCRLLRMALVVSRMDPRQRSPDHTVLAAQLRARQLRVLVAEILTRGAAAEPVLAAQLPVNRVRLLRVTWALQCRMGLVEQLQEDTNAESSAQLGCGLGSLGPAAG